MRLAGRLRARRIDLDPETETETGTGRREGADGADDIRAVSGFGDDGDDGGDTADADGYEADDMDGIDALGDEADDTRELGVDGDGDEVDPGGLPAGALPRRGLRVVFVLAALVVTALVGWIAGRQVDDPIDTAQAADQDLPPLSVEVEEQALQDRLVARGAVGWAKNVPVAVTNPPGLEGSVPAITKLPTRDHDLAEGGVLVEVSFRPVFALTGGLPAVRDLHRGMEGPDVAQLQASLSRLGLLGTHREGRFDRATQQAVEDLYERSGYEAPEGLPDAGETPTSPSTTSPTTQPDPAAPPTPPATGQEPQPEAYLPVTEVRFLAELPGRVSSLRGRVGDDPTVLDDVLTLSTGGHVVNLRLSPTDARAVKVGQPAEVTDDVSGSTVAGKVAAVAGNVDSEDGLLPVRITLDQPDPALVGHNVRVSILVAGATEPALVVPAAAVVTRADGTSVVEVLDAGGTTRRVVVTTGFGADGLLEVTPVEPGALEAGDRVVVEDV